MGTSITDSEGNLLWSPRYFGEYSEEKVQAIADILKALLTEITINTSERIEIDEETKDGFYTKNQVDEKLKSYVTFNQLGDLFTPSEGSSEGVATAAIEKVVNEKFNSLLADPDGLKESLGINSLEELFNNFKDEDFKGLITDLDFLSQATIDCTFQDIMNDNKPIISQALTKEIQDMIIRFNSTDSNVNNILDFLGSTDITLNTVAKTVRGAINEINSSVSSNTKKIGSDSLKTTAETISGAINELLDISKSSETKISSLVTKTGEDTLNTTAKNLSSAVNEIYSTSESNKQSIQSIQTKIGSSELTTEAKNISDATNEVSDKVKALSTQIGEGELSKSIIETLSDITSELQSISDRLSIVESKLT